MDKVKVVKPGNCDLFSKTAKILVLMTLLTSCSAEWHLQRAIKKAPYLLSKDTLRVVDTLIVRDSIVSSDTLILRSIDTVTIDDGKVITEVIRVHDTFMIKTVVRPDTVRVKIPVKIPGRVIYSKPEKSNWFVWLVTGIAAGLIISLYYEAKRS